MTATAGHPALRARFAQALAEYLEGHSAAHIADLLGVATSTVTRRENDLTKWPFLDLVQLASGDQSLMNALLLCLRGEIRNGEGVRIHSDLIAEISAGATVTSRIGEALKDGRVSPQEARSLLDAIHAMRRHEDEKLLPDLLALIGGRP